MNTKLQSFYLFSVFSSLIFILMVCQFFARSTLESFHNEKQRRFFLVLIQIKYVYNTQYATQKVQNAF